MNTNRLEAFSDGVMSVAITLLVLDIHVPQDPHHTLAHGLLEQWPTYAAYVISFLTIGIIWINHHAMLGRLRQADHSILILNLLLLMCIVLLPFATSMMSTYLKRSQGQHLAAAIYGAALLAMAITFSLLQRQILLRRATLLRDPLTGAERRRIFRRSASGIAPYVLATALAALTPYATLLVSGLLAGFYALPIASGT